MLRLVSVELLAALLLWGSAASFAQIPSSSVKEQFVGTIFGEPSPTGVGDFRTDAPFVEMTDFAFLPGGEVLIADAGQDRILRVDADGIVRLVAGNGLRADSGDGGPATEASLFEPRRVAVDGAGNVFVSTWALAREPDFAGKIRRIAPDGTISTVAGNGQAGCPEDGAFAVNSPLNFVSAMAASRDGALYLVTNACDRIYRLERDGVLHVITSAPEGQLFPPSGQVAAPVDRISVQSVADLAVDASGNLVGVDGHSVAFRVTPEGVFHTIVGHTSPQNPQDHREGDSNAVFLGRLVSVALFPNGEVVLANDGSLQTFSPSGLRELGVVDSSSRYRVLLAADGFGGRPGFGEAPILTRPGKIRVDALGDLYILDESAQRIVRMAPGGTLEHFAGRAPQLYDATLPSAPKNFRGSINTNPVSDSIGNLYFVANGRLLRLSPEGVITHLAGNTMPGESPDGTPPLEAALSFRTMLAIDDAVNLYWSPRPGTVRKLSPAGVISTVVGGGSDRGLADGKAATSLLLTFTFWGVAGNGDVYFWYAPSLSWLSREIWRVDSQERTVWRHAGKTDTSLGVPDNNILARDAHLYTPERFSVAPDGTLYFTRQYYGPIYRIDPQGVLYRVATNAVASAPVDGDPTITATSFVQASFWAQSEYTLALSVSTQPILAQYVAGGNVAVWRNAPDGFARHDGGPLKDDRYQPTSQFAVLADSGLAWAERHRGTMVLRRSFPVPLSCTSTYTPAFTEYFASGTDSQVSLPLSAGANCPWTVGASATWVEIQGPRAGRGPTTVELRLRENPSPLERSALVWVAGKEVLVRQAGSPRQDLLFVSPSFATVPAQGGAVDVTVTASPSLPWQVAVPNASIAVEGASAGSGSAAFRLRLEALPGGVMERTVLAEVNGRPIRLRQSAPAQPVNVTITSTSGDGIATVDLVERNLPYVAEWLPGSYHHVKAPEFQAAAEGTIRQLRGFGADPKAKETFFFTPLAGGSVTAHYRTLHAIQWDMKSHVSVRYRWLPALEFQGLQVPEEFRPAAVPERIFVSWFPEGTTVGVLAREESSQSFERFSGLVETTENPTKITVQSPGTLAANYVAGPPLIPQSPYLLSAGPRFTFYGNSRDANPWPITVSPRDDGAPLSPPKVFISYGADVDSAGWLQWRQSGEPVPFAVEVGVNRDHVAIKAPAQPSGFSASVHIHQPGFETATQTVHVEVSSVPTGTQPWIAAVTDAGGFRQFSVSNEQTPLALAPGMIVSVFGLNLATEAAPAPSVPLPTTLGNVRIEVNPLGGNAWTALPLFYAAPNQVNALLPEDLLKGEARGDIWLRASRGGIASGQWRLAIRPLSASLFSADSSGKGAVAGFFVRVLPDQTQERGSLATCLQGECAVNAVSFGAASNELFLELYGTGFRSARAPESLRVFLGGRPLEIPFAGPHPEFVGLDQLNVKVPSDIPRGVDLDLSVWVRNGEDPWQASNRLTVRFE